MRIPNLNVVVTGSSGFIGTHLVHRLRADGHDVAGIDRVSAGPTKFAMDLTRAENRRPLETLLGRADAVFHLAGRPGVRDRHPDIDHFRQRDNVDAALAVLELTPLHVPVIAASSSSVYGNSVSTSGNSRPCHEDDRCTPLGGYGRSKIRMESLFDERLGAGGRAVVVRPFTVAGEGQRPDMALSIWLEAIERGHAIRLLGSPDRSRDITDIGDVVEALVRLVRSDWDGTVNLGTGVGHTLLEMAEAVVRASGRVGRIEVVSGSDDEATATLADTSRLESLVGFVPRTDLDAVVERMVAVRSRRLTVAAR